jgi:Cu+-exporting ATPase
MAQPVVKQASVVKTIVDVRGMHCAACTSAVEKAAKAVAGVQQVAMSLATETATIIALPTTDMGEVIASIRRAGYECELPTGQDGVGVRGSGATLQGDAEATAAESSGGASAGGAGEAEEGKATVVPRRPMPLERRWLIRTVIGVPIAASVMVIAMVYGKAPWSPWWQLGLTGALMLLVGVPIWIGAARAIARRALDMDVLIALGTTAAFGWSLYVLLAKVPARLNATGVYFESAAVILALVALGRWMELRTRAHAASAVRSLMDLSPPVATKFTGQRAPNDTVEVPASTLVAGDRILIKSGQRLPADGVCLQGTDSAVDESMLTGESVPVTKRPGDKATGGTLNTSGLITLEVTASGQRTVLAGIARVVHEAQSRKGKLQRLADRVSGIFVPIVLGVAVLALLYWGVVASSWPTGVKSAVAVLIVACPCALGLAVPMAIMIGSSVGARRGILFKDPTALENTAKLTCCVLDKTGTLTAGQMFVTDLRTSQWFEQQSALQHIHAVTRLSDHPVSKAITLRMRELNIRAREATGFHSLSNSTGVMADVEGQEVYVGMPTPGILEAAGDDYKRMLTAGSTVAVATIGKRYAAIFAISDRAKPHARESIKRLIDEHKMRVLMVTGDHANVAEAIALEAGISEFRSGVRPEAKALIIQSLQRGEKGEDAHAVAMVGDGINDAPALATADVGIAVGRATDIARQAGHIVLTSSDLRQIPQAITLAKAMMQHIRLGLALAFAYNVILIPVAAAGYLEPMYAAVAMSLSSISVIGCALWLKRVVLE